MENDKIAKSINSLLNKDSVKKRFNEILGNKSNGFISSVINATKNNTMLQNADPNSILSAAVVAASLDLPIDSNLGFAAIVPFNDKKSGKILAQFQMMYKGFVQLAQRSGQYKSINVCEIYDGEIEMFNRITGEINFNPASKKSEKIIGYAAYFKLVNGFEKTLYMSDIDLNKHGKRFSQSFKKGYGLWIDDFDSMAMKTVLKRLLSKYGILSIDMQNAVKFDQAIIKEDGEAEYVDHEDISNQKQLEKSDLDIAKEKLIDAIDKMDDLANQAVMKAECLKATKDRKFDLEFCKSQGLKIGIEL
jgi:recombination protein RecT